MAVAAGIAAAGQIGGALVANYGARKESYRARRFQRQVLQNSVQWKVADLKKAGLNPILAAGGGLGGSGAPSPVAAQYTNPGANLGQVLSGAAQYGRNKAEIKLLKAQAEKLRTDTDILAPQRADARTRLGVANSWFGKLTTGANEASRRLGASIDLKGNKK